MNTSQEPKDRKLPNMNEFSPAVVGELRPLLDVIKKNEGDRERLKEAVFQNSISIKKVPNGQHYNRANNVLIGLSQCGLFNLDTNQLTDLGNALLTSESDLIAYEKFTKHILESCYGVELLDIVRSLRKRHEPISLKTIRGELRVRGFKVTENEGNPSKMRAWMEKAGLVKSDWEIDEELFTRLLGISSPELHDWKSLTRGQQAFLITLQAQQIGTQSDWISGSLIKRECELKWGKQIFPDGQLRAKVIFPLASNGWIETRGKGEGRGGFIGDVRATSKLVEIQASLGEIKQQHSGIPVDLLDKLDIPIDQIYSNLESANTFIKGIALELLCIHIVLGLGLSVVAFRKRGDKTQGAEIDVLAEGVHLHYSRWLFQCKNKPNHSVDVEDLAKEIGMAVLLKAHVVVMVTTGKFSKVVKQYSNGTAQETYLQVILIDGRDLQAFRKSGPMSLVDKLHSQGNEVLKLKEIQVRPVFTTIDDPS